MITLAAVKYRMKHLQHKGVSIVEISMGGLSYDASAAMVREYADFLRSLKKGQKARALINFEGATYDPRLVLLWKAELPAFTDKVHSSALLGVSPIIAAALHGYASTASLSGQPLDRRRAVVFESRGEALEFLAGD